MHINQLGDYRHAKAIFKRITAYSVNRSFNPNMSMFLGDVIMGQSFLKKCYSMKCQIKQYSKNGKTQPYMRSALRRNCSIPLLSQICTTTTSKTLRLLLARGKRTLLASHRHSIFGYIQIWRPT